MQNIIFRIVAKTERVLTAIAAALMAVLSIIVCWQVFARYILQKEPHLGRGILRDGDHVGRLARSAAAAVWTGDHMRLEILTKKAAQTLWRRRRNYHRHGYRLFRATSCSPMA